MNPWFGKAVFILGVLTVGRIRDPYIKRNKTQRIAEDRKSRFDLSLIALVGLGGVVLPIAWMALGILSFADTSLHPAAFAAGVALLVAGLWLFKRSHEDLGTQWSVSLEIKENHRVVKTGVYRTIRHPMYSSLFLYSAAQGLLLPNWVVGPAGFVTFAILYFGRLKSEETLMLDRFGEEYRVYMNTTRRLIPGVW